MSNHTVLVENIMERRVVARLELADGQVESTLNRPGSMNGSISMEDPNARLDVLSPYRMAMYYMRDGLISWGGIITDAQVADNSEFVDITATGWLGYWDDRDIWISYQAITDQFNVFKALVDDAQSEGNPINGVGADLHIEVVWDELSGVEIDTEEEYLAIQARNLGAELRALGGADDGFDFKMEYSYTDEVIEKKIRLAHPKLERETGVHLEYDHRTGVGNVVSRGISLGSGGRSWRTRGWSSAPEESRIFYDDVVEENRGVIPFYDQTVGFDTTLRSKLALLTRAETDRSVNRRPVPSITVNPDHWPNWRVSLGDIVHVNIVDRIASFQGTARTYGMTTDLETGHTTLHLEISG